MQSSPDNKSGKPVRKINWVRVWGVILVLAGIAVSIASIAAPAAPPSGAEASRHPFRGITISSYKLAGIRPSSMRSVLGTVNVTVANRGEMRSCSKVVAHIYRNDRHFATGTADDVTISRGTAAYTCSGEVRLADEVSVIQAIGAALAFKIDEYYVDATMRVTYEDGFSETVRRRVPARTVMRKR